MNRKYSLLALFASAFLWFAFPNDPPNGNTGAPGENTCGTNCHTLNGNTQTGNVTVTGMPTVIEPCMAYVLTVTSTKTGPAVVAGFQLTILNSLDQMSGVLSSPSSGSAIQMESGRQYWEHNMPATYPGSNMVMWTATWTAPSSPANTTVTYYVANNIANSNGFDTGDLIVTASGGGTLNGGAPVLTVSITNVTNVLCNGQNTGSATATPAGGITPYTYNWSNGATTQTINNLAAAMYTVTVTDMCTSTKTASITIGQPPLLVLNTPTITNVSCNGGNNGSITAHGAGGVSPYSYDWSNGSSGATITNLTPGAYTVTVTDNNACTKTATYQVTQPTPVVIALVSLTNESCSGANDGAITISATGGVPPIFVEWSNGFIGTTITGLPPETYSVTVTDNNACTKTASFTINPGGIVNVATNQIQNVLCFGGANGSISVTASGGLAPYTYDWSNGSSGSVITGLTAGSYILTATDSHGCEVVKAYTITQPTVLAAQIMQPTQNLCFGDNTADLTSTVSGGTSPYTALWSNGIVGLNNSNLAAGTYTITVTDDNSCTSTKSAIITTPTQVTAAVSTTNETGVGTNNGTATATAGGGTPIYTYLWSNGATTPGISGLTPDMYCVTITDMNGCTNSACGIVSAFGCALDVTLGQDVTICENTTTIIKPLVTAASGNITYLWTDGSTADSLLVSQGGEYCVTVNDEAGCQDMDCILVNQNSIPDLECPVINESSPGAHDGAVQCDGITGIATFLWSTGATTPSITGLSPGVYCVTVADVNGCTKSQCFNVQPGNCQLSITSVQTNNPCSGDTIGSIVVTANHVNPPVTFTWSDGESTATINNLGAGSYAVTVSDASGCFATDSYTITEPDPISIALDTIINISDVGPGSIHVSVSGGIQPYQYVWTLPNGALLPGVEDLDGLTDSGNYQLGITDQNGCTVLSAQFFVASDVAVTPEPKYKSLKVYPVPVKDVLFVEIEKPITEVLISGIDGRLCKRIVSPSSNQIDVLNLESGWYIIRISDGNTWYISQFVK